MHLSLNQNDKLLVFISIPGVFDQALFQAIRVTSPESSSKYKIITHFHKYFIRYHILCLLIHGMSLCSVHCNVMYAKTV